MALKKLPYTFVETKFQQKNQKFETFDRNNYKYHITLKNLIICRIIRNFTKNYEIFAKNDDFSGSNGQNDFCRGSIESLGSKEEDRTKTPGS